MWVFDFVNTCQIQKLINQNQRIAGSNYFKNLKELAGLMKEPVAIYNSEFFGGKFQPICPKKRLEKEYFVNILWFFGEKIAKIKLK
jgi:hypothetical protein